MQPRVAHVPAGALGHVAPAQRGVAERRARVLPLGGLRAPEALRRARGGGPAAPVRVVVGAVLLEEGLRGDLAQEQDADVVAQAAGAARERGGACVREWGLTMRGSSWRTWTSSVRVAMVSV